MIDLHTHSYFSDGTLSPEEVIRQAHLVGLAAVALTDHDTVAGWGAARTCAAQLGITFVPGVEISALWQGRSVHLLGYAFDENAPELLEMLAGTRRSRAQRIQKMAQNIAGDFPPFRALLQSEGLSGSTSSLGRPHIADALIECGLAADRYEAFQRFLGFDSPYYVRLEAPELAQAIAVLTAAGGFAVLAHPSRSPEGVLGDLPVLVAAGLRGIEVHHRDNDADLRRRLSTACEQFDLVETGGSDFHGSGKTNLLGENTTAPAVLQQILRGCR